QAAKLAPGDKPVRLALKSLRIKQEEVEAARRSLWGGVFKGGAAKTPAPGRRQVEEAAARARGEGLQDPGRRGGGDRRGGAGGDRLLYASIAVGLVAFAVAGFTAAKYA
ncbi:unnamed protein product, partial [Ectocarpus sp. 13 AM-2016]